MWNFRRVLKKNIDCVYNTYLFIFTLTVDLQIPWYGFVETQHEMFYLW